MVEVQAAASEEDAEKEEDERRKGERRETTQILEDEAKGRQGRGESYLEGSRRGGLETARPRRIEGRWTCQIDQL